MTIFIHLTAGTVRYKRDIPAVKKGLNVPYTGEHWNREKALIYSKNKNNLTRHQDLTQVFYHEILAY